MKNVAIALYGPCDSSSQWWKKNVRYDDENTIIFKYAIPKNVSIAKLIPRFNTVHQSVRRVLLNDHCCGQLSNTIAIYEHDHKMEFDIKIFTNFNTVLLEYPVESGVYYTPYYSFVTLVFPNPLPCIEIVSNTHIRINGGYVVNVNDLSKYYRKILFDLLFQGKVLDYDETMDEFKVDISMFIPSVINVSKSTLDYSTYRSVFTPEERLLQTMEQIKSIRRLTRCTPFVLEGSPLDLSQMARLVETDTFVVLFSQDHYGHYYANHHKNKSGYEVYVLLKILDKVYSQWFFKFGGRYRLMDHFTINTFLKQTPVYKTVNRDHSHGKTDIIECVLYSFPQSHQHKYITMYTDILNIIQTSTEGIETLLFTHSPTFEQTDMLGVYGYDAIEAFDNAI